MSNTKCTAIFKSKEENYVPVGVSLRSRISSTMFTGEFEESLLPSLEEDTGLISFTVSKKLQLI